jgi:hypothetical protein
MLSTYTAPTMRLRNVKDYGFILDAIEMMPKKKRFRVNLKTIDRTLAFVVTAAYAATLYLILKRHG